MDEAALAQFLQRKIADAMNGEDGEVSETRQDSMDYYVGKKYGNERDGFSSVVTRETMETIEWAKPSILRSLLRDKPAVFDAQGQMDERQAEHESQVVNHILTKKNNAFLEVYQWVTDLLMYPNGYLKIWCEEEEIDEEYVLTGVTPPQLMKLEADPNIEIIAASEPKPVIVNGQQVIEEYEIRVHETGTRKKYCVRATPPEEVLVESSLDSIDLDRSNMVVHRYKATWTDLVEAGHDPDLLMTVGSGEASYTFDDEEQNRKFYTDEDPDTQDDDGGDPSMREYWVHECWGRWDEDGEGKARRRRAIMIGQTIFPPIDGEDGDLSEEVDYQPFVAASAIVMAHRHVGMSFFEIMRDLQLIRSVIKRQILDNAYRHNLPKKYIGERFTDTADGGTGVEEALEDAETEYVYCGDPSAIQFEQQPMNIISDLLAVDNSLKEDIQNRTGVAPNLSLDPAVLQQATMGAYMGAMEAATQRIELIVRLLAEIGMKPACRKVHQLLRLHQDTEMEIKMNDEWVPVDPRTWRERDEMSVTVGLGYRNPAEKLQLYDLLLAKQEKALAMGMTDLSKIYNTLEKQIDLANLGQVEEFFTKPEKGAMPPQQQDPQAGIIQAQMQVEGQKVQQRAEEANAKNQLEFMKLMETQAENQRKHEREMKKMELQLQETQGRLMEMMARIENLDITNAKTLQEARQLDIENDATETGMLDLAEQLEEFENERQAAIG